MEKTWGGGRLFRWSWYERRPTVQNYAKEVNQDEGTMNEIIVKATTNGFRAAY